MISGDFSECKNLWDFYAEIVDLHGIHHQPSYLDVHYEILFLLQSGCKSYKEFGVNQGATLACALLAEIPEVYGYDIKLSNFEPYRALFEDYAVSNKIDFRAEERSSLDASTLDDVDLLYIDTLHTGEHLRKELDFHANTVNKYIVCHDTFANPGMHRSIQHFCQSHPHWKIEKYHTVNVGYTTLKRIDENLKTAI